MFKSATATALASLFLATSAIAESGPVVVELFTSQGCSSCPPADRIMQDLANRDDVIGLALHVDYWDYIGWEDEYADPTHTERQRSYAGNSGRTVIYTPQMVVNGQQDIVGADTAKLDYLIGDHSKAAPLASVSASRTGDNVTVDVSSISLPPDQVYDIRVVQYTPMRHASIRRGELAGQELDYANVVEAWTVAGQWDGTAPKTYKVSLTSGLPAVVLVQGVGHGPIIAAARVR